MTEILTHDAAVRHAYYLVTTMFDCTSPPEAKRQLLKSVTPYFDQLARAEAEAYRRSEDETLTDFERMVAERDSGIINHAAGMCFDFMTFGWRDKRLAALLRLSD